LHSAFGGSGPNLICDLVYFSTSDERMNESSIHKKRAVVSQGRCAKICNQNIKVLSKNAAYFLKLGHCVRNLPF
jgi:hypothetical protein